MSKHRHKSRDINRMRNPSFNNCMNNNPFGISPQQLMGLLGSNIDMTGIGNILSSMGQDGFNMNSINTQMNNNSSNDYINNDNNNSNMNFNKEDKAPEVKNTFSSDDENIRFLESIKSIVSGEKAQFIDKVIELYHSGAFKDFKK